MDHKALSHESPFKLEVYAAAQWALDKRASSDPPLLAGITKRGARVPMEEYQARYAENLAKLRELGLIEPTGNKDEYQLTPSGKGFVTGRKN